MTGIFFYSGVQAAISFWIFGVSIVLYFIKILSGSRNFRYSDVDKHEVNALVLIDLS